MPNLAMPTEDDTVNRRLTITTCLLIALLSACRGVAPGAPGTGASGLASGSIPPPSGSDGVAPSPTCDLGVAIAEYAYPGLRELVAEFRSVSRAVAIGEVVSVGELQYSTESGDRPSCDEIEAAPSGFSIGRMVEISIATPVAGAVKKGQVLSYLYQGGSLGRDSSPGHPFGLATPREGDRMLVLISREPIDADPGTGELPVEVLEMFLVTPQGSVVTPDPSERVPVARVAELLRDVLPSASPSS
jgi:hypothetical protein